MDLSKGSESTFWVTSGIESVLTMSPAPLHILFVEDQETDALLMQDVLRAAGLLHTSRVVDTEHELREALSLQTWDIVLSDYSMPELIAFKALALVREIDEDLPFILVSGSVGEETAVEMVKAGAQDYVLKENLIRLPVTIQREIREAEERRARKRAETSLRASEERIRLAAGAANLGVWSYDVATNIVSWDEQCYLSTGTPLGQTITAEYLESIIHPDDRLKRRQILSRAFSEGTDAKMEYRIIRPDGGVRWISSYGRAILRDDGSVKEVLGIATDITDRKLAEEALRIKEARFRGLSASSPVGIFEADLDANVRYTNPRLQSIWQMNETEVLGRGWMQRIHPDDIGALMEGWAAASSQGLPFEIDYRLVLPDGKIRWIHGRSSTVLDDQNKPISTIGTVDDFTERRKAEEAVRCSEKLAAVGQLASTIAHEINNPLEAVINLIYLAEMSPELTESIRSLLTDAQHELQRVAHIVTQTLQFHRRNTDKAEVAISSILESALNLFTRRMKEQRIFVDRDYADVPNVVCYSSEIRQVFVNLISNSIDAMVGKPGGLQIRIRNGAFFLLGQRSVRITIADTGMGMDPTVSSRIFDAFFTTKEEKGSGLGLWVSSEILKRHGGTIRIRSRRSPYPSGTLISITLPVTGMPISFDETRPIAGDL